MFSTAIFLSKELIFYYSLKKVVKKSSATKKNVIFAISINNVSICFYLKNKSS